VGEYLISGELQQSLSPTTSISSPFQSHDSKQQQQHHLSSATTTTTTLPPQQLHFPSSNSVTYIYISVESFCKSRKITPVTTGVFGLMTRSLQSIFDLFGRECLRQRFCVSWWRFQLPARATRQPLLVTSLLLYKFCQDWLWWPYFWFIHIIIIFFSHAVCNSFFFVCCYYHLQSRPCWLKRAVRDDTVDQRDDSCTYLGTYLYYFVLVSLRKVSKTPFSSTNSEFCCQCFIKCWTIYDRQFQQSRLLLGPRRRSQICCAIMGSVMCLVLNRGEIGQVIWYLVPAATFLNGKTSLPIYWLSFSVAGVHVV